LKIIFIDSEMYIQSGANGLWVIETQVANLHVGNQLLLFPGVEGPRARPRIGVEQDRHAGVPIHQFFIKT